MGHAKPWVITRQAYRTGKGNKTQLYSDFVLDAHEGKYIEEVGAMNVFFVIGDKVITPNFREAYYPNNQKKHIEIAEALGYKTEERKYPLMRLSKR